MKTITALVLVVTAALVGCAGTSGSPGGGSGYRNGSGVEMFGTIDMGVRRVETK